METITTTTTTTTTKSDYWKEAVLPARNTKELNRLLQKKLEVKTIIVDVKERAMNRPKNNEVL